MGDETRIEGALLPAEREAITAERDALLVEVAEQRAKIRALGNAMGETAKAHSEELAMLAGAMTPGAPQGAAPGVCECCEGSPATLTRHDATDGGGPLRLCDVCHDARRAAYRQWPSAPQGGPGQLAYDAWVRAGGDLWDAPHWQDLTAERQAPFIAAAAAVTATPPQGEPARPDALATWGTDRACCSDCGEPLAQGDSVRPVAWVHRRCSGLAEDFVHRDIKPDNEAPLREAAEYAHRRTLEPPTTAGPVLTEQPEETMLYVHDHGDDFDPACRYEVCLTIAGERYFSTETEARAALGEVQAAIDQRAYLRGLADSVEAEAVERAALMELAAASPHTEDRTEPPPWYDVANDVANDEGRVWRWDAKGPEWCHASKAEAIAACWAHYDKTRGAR